MANKEKTIQKHLLEAFNAIDAMTNEEERKHFFETFNPKMDKKLWKHYFETYNASTDKEKKLWKNTLEMSDEELLRSTFEAANAFIAKVAEVNLKQVFEASNAVEAKVNKEKTLRKHLLEAFYAIDAITDEKERKRVFETFNPEADKTLWDYYFKNYNASTDEDRKHWKHILEMTDEEKQRRAFEIANALGAMTEEEMMKQILKVTGMGQTSEKLKQVLKATDKGQTGNKLQQAFEIFAEETKMPAVRLKPVRRETSVYGSKLGGTPYLPHGFSYPCDSYPGRGHPLVLLAQLNFAELPRLEGFPDHGILQFYCSDDDEYGANYGNADNQAGFKVVYHENVVKDEQLLGVVPNAANKRSEYFPFKGEFALSASLVDSVPFEEDYRFEEIVSRFIQKNPSCAIIQDGGYEPLGEYLSYERKLTHGSRIGGYPYFCQYDHRGTEEGYTVLLLQIDSENWEGNPKGKDVILWGDAGVANFFIRPEDLAKRDFSRIIFNWDCS